MKSRQTYAARFGALALGRALAREQCVRFFEGLVRVGIGREAAMARAARVFRFSASEASVRRWERQYLRKGFSGLLEHKAGRVGRKAGQSTKRHTRPQRMKAGGRKNG